MKYIFSTMVLIVAFIIGLFFGWLVADFIFKMNAPREIGMCQVTQRPQIFCVNGELVVENPNYVGKTALNNSEKFLPIIRGGAYCSCSDKTTENVESSILLGDSKESVRIEDARN